MSNQQHTPGPWIVSANKTAVLSLTPVEMNDQRPCPVVVDCASGYDAMDFEEAKANARLIAASPDILAALERWAQYAADNGYSTDEKAPGYCSFLADTLAAIAKARGE